MQREIGRLTQALREFVAQPNYPTLVLVGSDAGIVFPNRILAALDRQDDDAYYLLFPQPCASAEEYFELVLASLRTQLEIVWGLLPGELTDVSGYRALVEPLLASERVPPWMDRHRFLLRDRREAPSLAPELYAQANDRVPVLDLDLDQARVTSSLAESAADRSLLVDERMLAFFQLGGVDMALGRRQRRRAATPRARWSISSSRSRRCRSTTNPATGTSGAVFTVSSSRTG